LKKGKYVGTWANAQFMQVISPTAKQNNFGGVRTQ
jgi:hypothetical protein